MTEKKAAGFSSRILDFAIIALIVYLGSQYLFPQFFGPQEAPPEPVVLSIEDNTLARGQDPILVIQNNLATPLAIPATCPKPFVTIAFSVDGAATGSVIEAGEPAITCVDTAPIPAGESANVSLGAWKYKAFTQDGIYTFTLTAETSSGGVVQPIGPLSAKAVMTEAGLFGKLYDTIITRPFLNILVGIASFLPGHNLGWAILILTLLVKIILFIPTQHALEGQKKMQLLQPKIEATRKQYADDAQKMNAEIMKIWKEEKINPFQSCLPILFQFPILIGLFHVIRDAHHLPLSKHLLYTPFADITWTFDPHFLGLDLTQSYPFLFVPVLVVLQFIQMKLSFYIADKKKAKKVDDAVHQADNPQDLQQKIMLYALPLMIGFFALTVPSAVSVYWGISTLFAIGQQVIVNREHLKVKGE